MLTSIRDSLDVEGRLAVHTLSEMCDMSIGAVYKVMTKQLNMSKVPNLRRNEHYNNSCSSLNADDVVDVT